MRLTRRAGLILLVVLFATSGCGSFVARRIAQAPNRYPGWLAPNAPVELAYSPGFLTNFTAKFIDISPPQARLRYRVVEPADYHLAVSSTNWSEGGRPQFEFSFQATVPGQSNAWTRAPRGTVVLLHGYGEAQFAMAPWALRLAEDGWRCVLVDLRGHGRSTGRRIFFGIQETHDVSRLLDTLEQDGRLKSPVEAFGECYGGALALRWKTVEPRIENVVAITPYAVLSNAVMNIRHEYAAWFPRALVRSGIKHLPSLFHVPPDQLDTTAVLAAHPVSALFVAAEEDKIVTVADVRQLYQEAAPGSQWVLVPGATHEAVTYFFKDIAPPALSWLRRNSE